MLALNTHKDDPDVALGACGTMANLAINSACSHSTYRPSALTLWIDPHRCDACGFSHVPITCVRGSVSAPAKEAAIQQHAPEMMKAVAAKHKSVKAVKVQANNAYKLLTGSATPRSGGRKFSLFGKTLTIGGSK